MADNAGGDCVSIFCGCCCVAFVSALSTWCNTGTLYMFISKLGLILTVFYSGTLLMLSLL
ncbi:hypothetical protein J3R30DRAFT_20344 [Lentinula aciculospora]|uniref:Uncharacterized protein n=1 Tax=Lentinula aciculospora TaxID=153920 RepID=A0A9W9DYM2_9AGAR|nr:hypothetical protein J3R30DRAFT_20344 [Lentinula aciculospora]